MKQQVVIILGMHRSGTSCLAGSLEQAGLDLGAVNTDAPWNRRGNRESILVQEINEKLLNAAGGAWSDPPDRVAWSEDLRRRRNAFVGSFSGAACWGFKDPRTLFTLEGWMEGLRDREVRFAASFRHPEAVARSLANRNDFSREKSLDLWRRYNARLLALCEREAVPLINFDLSPARYLEAVRALARGLGLEPPASDDPFFDRALRQFDGGDAPLDPGSDVIYRGLLSRAIT